MTGGSLLEKPFIKLFHSPNSGYFYDVGKNEILRIPENVYQHLVQVMDGMSSLEKPEDESAIEMINSFIELGYLSTKRPVKILHSATNFAHLYLDRCIGKITLQLTQECNFRCKYCIYSEEKNKKQRSHTNESMSLETAQKAILFYREHAVDSNMYDIGFYGGEPLLAWDTLKESVLFAERELAGKPVSFSITTNASLLTESKATFLQEHNVNVMVSLDGVKEIHDLNRVLPNGRGTYDLVLRNLRMLKSHFPSLYESLRISTVVDPRIDVSLFGKYPELISDLPLANYSVSIEENTDQNVSLPHELCVELEKETQLAFLAECGLYSGIIKPYGYNQVRNIRNRQNALRSTSGITDIMAPGGPCVPGKSRLFITCKGNFYPCERVNETEANCIGNLERGFDIGKVKRILNVGAISSDKCKNCWAFRLCTICIKRFDYDSGSASEEKNKLCSSVQAAAFEYIRWMILIYEIENNYSTVVRKRANI